MIPSHLTSSKVLETDESATRNGFVIQALAKTREATQYVKEARGFLAALKEIKTPSDLLLTTSIRSELLAAAGLSDKAKGHFNEEGLLEALHRVLDPLLQRERGWREEILYRYLLTKGDSLGGSMRNLTGAYAARELADQLVSRLKSQGAKPSIGFTSSSKEKVEYIEWKGRIILFDKTVPISRKNVDLILLKRSTRTWDPKWILADKGNYVACGELKGGIDPAGADEHWKTANTALTRIRVSFPEGERPRLFFAGAAIVPAMATEIFQQLAESHLDYAANLTKPEQVAKLVDWLIAL